MQRVVLFSDCASKFGVLGQMIRDLQAAFSRFGIHSQICDLDGKTPADLVPIIRDYFPDCTWTINTALDEGWFYNSLGIPHIDLSVDAATYTSRASFTRPHLVSLFVDQTSCDLFSRFSDNPVHHFPHGIAKEILDHLRTSLVPQLKNRPYDLVLLGSFIDHEEAQRSWDRLFSPSDVEALTCLAVKSLDDPSFLLPFETLRYLEKSSEIQMVLERIDLSPFSLVNSVELYARGLDRERLLESLSGKSVHIFTSASDAVQWAKRGVAKECVFHTAVPFSKVIDICMMAKTVIHSVPTIRKGYHERLFLSLASGAVTLVNKGSLLPRSILDTLRVFEYEASNLSSISLHIDEIAKRPFESDRVLSWLEEEHSWDARLRQCLPQISKSVMQLHTEWEENPFLRLAK